MAVKFSLASVKKGSKISMFTFTGMNLGIFDVKSADAKSITVTTTKGDKLFSKKTGKQTNCEEGKEKYANRLDAPVEREPSKPRTKVAKPKADKAEKPAPKVKATTKEPDPEPDAVDYNELTLAELRLLAKEREIKVLKKDKAPAIVALLEAQDGEAEDEDEEFEDDDDDFDEDEE